jgi:hypothetical protein
MNMDNEINKEKSAIINSFYCKEKGRKDIDGKWVIENEDFLYLSILDGSTGQTHIKFIKSPKIDFYITKIRGNKYTSPGIALSIDKLDKKRCYFKDRDLAMAEILNIKKEYFESCKEGWKSRKDFVQKYIYNNPYLYMADYDLEDFYINNWMESYGRDNYSLYCSDKLKHGFLDIEVDQFDHIGSQVTGENTVCPINLITYFHSPNNTLYSLILVNQDNSDIDYVKNNKEEFTEVYVKPNVHEDSYKYEYYFYNSEEDLLENFWKLIHVLKPDYVGIWNMNFDIPYILGRMNRLGISLDMCCHPEVPIEFRYVRYIEDGDRKNKFSGTGKGNTHPSRFWDWVNISGYTQFYDMMALYSILRKRYLLPSYKLDDIAKEETGYGKLDYRQLGYSIRKLAHQDFKIFLSYGMIDTIRLKQIENKTDDLNRQFIFTDNTRMSKGTSVSLTIKNSMYRYFLDLAPPHIIGNNVNYNEYEKISGAIVADPANLRLKGMKIGNTDIRSKIYDYIIDADEKSLYPNVIINMNCSKESLYGRIVSIYKNDELLESLEGNFNKLLMTLDASIFTIGEKYFGLPSYIDIIKDIEKIANKG